MSGQTRSEPSVQSRGFINGCAAGVFTLVALVWTYPLITHLGTVVLGGGPGDNLTGLWNFWWMREAVATHRSVFETSYLFAPIGVDLTLNTHMALPAAVGATLLARVPLVMALNLTILAALFLNGWCAYRLALAVTGDAPAAIVAGLMFAGATDVVAHLNGHFNLIDAWTLPLLALSWSRALRGARAWGLAAGLVVGLTLYIDYYYFVYEVVLCLTLLALAAADWSVKRAAEPPRRWLSGAVLCVLVADLVLIVGISAVGPLTLSVGARQLSVGVFNPLQLLWVLVAGWSLVRLRPRLRVTRAPAFRAGPAARAVAAAVASALLVGAPILWKAAQMVLRGDYVSQHYHWRSAPAGVDLASLLVGNPFHPIWGPAITDLYARLGLDLMESSGGWLGIVPLGLAIWTVTRHWRDPAARQWTLVGALFLVWALGPHLMAFGHQTGMILPETLVRYVPLASNARMPGRAMIVVDLAVAMLGAVALAGWRPAWRRPALALTVVAFAIGVDFLPAPFPTYSPDHPTLYDVLRDRPEQGAVCELPLGLRDGFGETGTFDHRVLFYQTIHGRPLVGGFVARLPPSVLAAYRADALLNGLLALSAPREQVEDSTSLPDGPTAAVLLRRDGIRFLVLNRATASAALSHYVDDVLPLVRIEDDHERTLFVVQDP